MKTEKDAPVKDLAEETADTGQKARLEVKQTMNWLDQPRVLPYRGFGNGEKAFISGRVLEDNGLAKPEANDSIWENVRAMYRRFKSDAIPGVRVQARFQDEVLVTETDDDGFFRFEFPVNGIDRDQMWHPVDLRLLDQVKEHQEHSRCVGEIMVPPSNSELGIISDVDDTILISHATNTWKKFRLIMLKNAHTRLPFEGVAAFYRALKRGAKANLNNPVFFVSSSEWNLYDLLRDFCRVQGIPKGTFLLKEFNEEWWKVWKSGGGSSHNHKLVKIRRILNTYPDLPFILIGDSGQHDAELYSKAVEEFPGRIRAIYIRDVSKEDRDAKVDEIAYEVNRKGVPMLLVKDTVAAASHAAGAGYISPQDIQAVRQNQRMDKRGKSM